VGDDPFYLKFSVSRHPLERNRQFWTHIHSWRLSRNTWRKKVNANRKSTMRFRMSLRWSSYFAPKLPKGALKNAKWPFSM